MLTLTLALGSLAGCSENAAPASYDTNAPSVPETSAEPTEPDDGSIRFYYDDRIPCSALGGSENSVIQILDQQVESTKVGSSDPDDAVLYLDEENHQFIAVGVGTATVDVDGVQVLIRVRPAPISLFMINGHSISAGQCGVAAQSIVV